MTSLTRIANRHHVGRRLPGSACWIVTAVVALALAAPAAAISILKSFAGGALDGANPEASLILDGSGNLYGTTAYGGASGNGTVFKVKTDGTGFTTHLRRRRLGRRRPRGLAHPRRCGEPLRHDLRGRRVE